MEPPEDFLFPFPPYPIQKDFMKNLYKCLENGNLGIFESPTGTGKTLSIICGTLKWLIDHKNKQKLNITDQKADLERKSKKIEDNNVSDWFSAQTEKIKINVEKQSLQKQLDTLVKKEEKRNKYKEQLKDYYEESKKKKNYYKYAKNDSKSNERNHSLNEKDTNQVANDDDIEDDLVLKDTDCKSDSSDEEEEVVSQDCKLYFCSRTHSQLAQFIGELKKTSYADLISVVPLASRTNYCINAKIKSLKNISIINEQCQQLQKKKSTSKKEKDLKRLKTATSCPYMPGEQPILMAEILTSIRDIEDTVKTSKELKTCPYYATRKSIEDAQLVLVPYNSILHKSTRISSGINLNHSILIIDEAHNLLEAIERMHSVTVTGKHILHCFNQLSQYQKRFETVLTAKNVLLLSQLSFCLKKLIKILGGTSKSCPDDKVVNVTTTKLYTLEDFETMAEIDTINIFDLIDFIQKSRLIHKLRGYAEKYEDDLVFKKPIQEKKGVSAFLETLQKKNNAEVKENSTKDQNEQEKEQITSPLIIITSFLETLKTNCSDGRIFVTHGDTIGQGEMKFLLLNPAMHFSDIIKEARAVILAGGTMEPISEFKDQLFLSAGAKPERIVTFSCDHVIPKENILTCILKSGPTGLEYEFNYQNRQNKKLLDELGRTIINICNIVPAGIVVFLPSYSYEELLFKHLETSGVLTKIGTKKSIFREPKSTTQVNQVLEKYASAIKKPLKPQNGAILFSVVGGKLSEGLNFSDDLGRCVVVVGMPYPNIKSPELQEKMKYLNENVNPNAGAVFYENACMKAVNQCIGRAVRHVADYSTVVLLDKRYANKTKSLPGWIQRTLTVQSTFGGAVQSLAKFFSTRKQIGTSVK
ncbi:ATP-dependent DNA helicase DDX11 [Copidosoma floridanum]|uniref:ATP-dependent DNA helicase DDX11 n=1 Tax=Copidosoma floridanum TaxID=29053 RepID=UPI0006C9A3E8|nr:ATP-dependent DNA helicase DDX11 [Copidosoma floridanum]XP_014208175.1 ATP-dependent DNA helicase DDX11 [Copidosoma floridanum]